MLIRWWAKNGTHKKGRPEPTSLGVLLKYLGQEGRDQGAHVASQLQVLGRMVWVLFVVYRGTPDEEDLNV